jgi:2-octaprenyl-6-methoxyphenol hydroxylase
MNICLIGNSLTSLALAKNLINKKINVSIFYSKINKFKNRTLGISKDNLDFIYKDIIKINPKLFWGIKEIEIFNENKKKEKILEFKNKNLNLFFMIRYENFYNALNSKLKKSKFCKKFFVKNDDVYKKILEKNKYDLIINCETNNKIYKNFFYSSFKKDYNSYAYSFIMNHVKNKNIKASQVFTKLGPIAFLPISTNQTSVVFSKSNESKSLNQKMLEELVKKYSQDYKIKKFSKFGKFKLNFAIVRKYYYKQVMILGDGLHKIHPLAGQGFNMTLRDIKTLSGIINNRIDLGLELNYSIYEEFEKKTKHFNLVFASGVDFIHEFFKFDNKFKNNYSTKLIKVFGKNKIFKYFFSNYADKGLML